MFDTLNENELSQLSQTQKVKLVDLRSVKDFEGNHYENSENIPYKDIPKHLNYLKNLGCQLIFICTDGSKAELARNWVKGHGRISKVAALEGGINTLQSAKAS